MSVLHLRFDAHSAFNSPESARLATPHFQAGLDAIRERLETEAARLLPIGARNAESVWLAVEISRYDDEPPSLVPELTKSAGGIELRLRVLLDGTGLWWLEDGEILRRIDLAATTALAMLARSRNADDSSLLQWLEVSVPCDAVDEGVPRCPYCHSRVRTDRTRQCRRCGNAWHDRDGPSGALPPARTDHPLEPVAPPPDVQAALAAHPDGRARRVPTLRQAAHPRARKLMPHASLWSITDELAPFGNDEGNVALEAFREWRGANPQGALLGFLDWTIQSPSDWQLPLTAEQAGDAFLATAIQGAKSGTFDFHNEVWRRDTNILASALAQLVCEGRIDADAKPFVQLAVERQSHPLVLGFMGNTRRRTVLMERVRAAIEAA